MAARRPKTDCSVTVDPKYSYFVVTRTSYYKNLQAVTQFTNCLFAENYKDLTKCVAATNLSFVRLKGSVENSEQLTTSSSAATSFLVTTFIDETFDDDQWN